MPAPKDPIKYELCKMRVTRSSRRLAREGKINYWKGRTFTEEHKRKIGQASVKLWANQREKMLKGPHSVGKGSKSAHWRGDDVGYQGLHQCIVQYYGKPTHCENLECNKISISFEWAKLRARKYKRRRENFIMLCASCHRKYDKNKNFNIKLN